jgi:RNA polymerase sigma factor for flagellar operon FliA
MVDGLKLVRKIACKMKHRLPACVDLGDLVQWGWFGLNDAEKSFDPSRGVKFETFATFRIRGAILDGIRSIDWVPRRVRGRGEEAKSIVSMDRPIDPDVGGESFAANLADPSPGPDAAIGETENFEQMIRCLPGEWRRIMRLYYVEQKTMKEVAREFGISKSRISQLHSQALKIIKSNETRPDMDITPIDIPTPTHEPDAEAFQPFRCHQLPGRRFSADEAAAEAQVSRGTLYNSVRTGRQIGPKNLSFYRDEPIEPRTRRVAVQPSPRPEPPAGIDEAIERLRRKLEAAEQLRQILNEYPDLASELFRKSA